MESFFYDKSKYFCIPLKIKIIGWKVCTLVSSNQLEYPKLLSQRIRLRGKKCNYIGGGDIEFPGN